MEAIDVFSDKSGRPEAKWVGKLQKMGEGVKNGEQIAKSLILSMLP